MKKIITVLFGVFYSVAVMAQVSLSECQKLARDNYPLIKQYDLIKSSTSYSILNAKKTYLPQVSFSGQATYQSDVMAFPDEFTSLFAQMGGLEMEGLNKDQYKVSLEVSQNIWDGGESKAKQKLHEAEGDVESKNIEVEMYSICERINAIYFGILLLEEQRTQNKLMQELLESNLEKVITLRENGVAMQSDADAVSVEILYAKQQYTKIDASITAYRQMLAIFTNNKAITSEVLAKPLAQAVVSSEVNRPELKLLESQNLKIQAQKDIINSSIKPRFGAFANGFYGNSGFDMFKDMMHSEWSWNYMVGVRMQWNIGRYYTKKNSINKLSTTQKQLNNRRETFLFNLSLQTAQEQIAIDQIGEVMKDDDKIIALRTSIRKGTEAKLKNGVVDINDLLREITAESLAKMTKKTHEIELLKKIYDLKNTINN